MEGRKSSVTRQPSGLPEEDGLEFYRVRALQVQLNVFLMSNIY